MTKSICILGCGGFIGSHLVEKILSSTGYSVTGIDISSAKIRHLLDNKRLTFKNLDVYDTVALRPYVEKCDVVISLVALCNPSLYTLIPLEVIDINLMHPLELVRICSELGKWLIHFSTCEVYGKTIAGISECKDPLDKANYVLNEDTSPLIMGPVRNQRWCYACAKQLVERLIYAYGFEKKLPYTILRPFNFIGPRMDYVPGIDGEGVPRVIACFMEALLMGKSLKLVDGGKNRRCFTYIDDAVEAVMAVLENPRASQGEIFNIGNPSNEITIAELAAKMIEIYRENRPELKHRNFSIEPLSSREFYGEGYEDSDRRVPDITKAATRLGWTPGTDLESALQYTVRGFIESYGTYAAG